MLSKLSKYLNSLLSHIRKCDLCHEPSDQFSMLCQDCYQEIVRFNLEKVSYDLLNWPSVYQAIQPIKFDHLVAVAPYHWPFDKWVSQLKYQGNFELAPFLSELMADIWLKQPNIKRDFDEELAIVAVPIHIKKWQQRGYNQAHLLAKQLAKRTNLTYLANVITRIHQTSNQVGLTGAKRRKNLKNAFQLMTNSPLPKHIILIDDVVTTGSTANEITHLLKQNGVKKVTLFTLCVALPDKS